MKWLHDWRLTSGFKFRTHKHTTCHASGGRLLRGCLLNVMKTKLRTPKVLVVILCELQPPQRNCNHLKDSKAESENALHLFRKQFRSVPPKKHNKRCHYERGCHLRRPPLIIPKVILRRVTQKIRILRSVGRPTIRPPVRPPTLLNI